MAHPTANAARIKLGAQWRPTWFRIRASDGAFSALNSPMSDDEVNVQIALLNGKRDRRAASASEFLIYLATVVASIGAAIYWAIH